MSKSKTESGSELLARLCQKSSLAQLEPELFPSGVEPRTVIELYGEEGSGKTQYLIHIIANAILPPSLNGAAVGGLGVSVMLIDNDYSFNLLRLISILELRISSASVSPVNPCKRSANYQGNLASAVCDTACANAENTASVDCHTSKKPRISESTAPSFTPFLEQSTTSPLEGTTKMHQTSQTQNAKLANECDIERCIKECLKRLYVVHCSSSSQLFITLHTLDTILANRSEICLLAIDSISSFFWLDKYNGTENNLGLVTDVLQKLAETYSLVVFAIKSSNVFQRLHKKEIVDHAAHKDEHKEYLCKTWQKLVLLRIIFSKDLSRELDLGNLHVFCASFGSREHKCFSIDETGVRFLRSEAIKTNSLA